ncbi:PPIC-type PPIASE domain protein [Burkholderia sp. MSHR3999]|uniref:peptidylprolyl isomerase n=1 Tax=Burkholderia sp. MSHR3999 TaxID=1542965 RepID=UPI0005B7019F|nr:peptidylprolyl isomerase [Burkholderia sp. MSHR3999]KIP17306.1 PPIC-type PPIASE domain protein [Burkholderia sp. MSHR3999]
MKNHIHSTKGIELRHSVAAIATAFVLAGCAHQAASVPSALVSPVAHVIPADAVAAVNGVPIDRTQVDALSRDGGQRDVIERGLIARELIRQAAEAEKLGDSAEVLAATNKARVDTENRLYIARHAVPRVVTEEQVRARYDAIAASLGPVSYKPRVIVLPNDAAAQAVLGRLASHESFESLASKESIDSSRTNGGALSWVTFKTPITEGHTQNLPLEVARALVKLRPGEYTRTPLAVGQARVLVKLDAKRPTTVPSYEQTRDELHRSLQNQAQEDAFSALVDSLAKQATIVRR